MAVLPAVASLCASGRTRALRERLAALVHGLFPPTCYLCLDPGQPPALDLCLACEQELPWLGCCCAVCAMPTPQAVERCARCDAAPHLFDAACVACRYEYPVIELIHRMKYRGELALARVLGTVLGHRLVTRVGPRPELVIPVPLHVARERERGFNQARELARYAVRELGLPLADGLVRRLRVTAEQAALPAAERQANLRGAFVAGAEVAGRNVAIVDDVLTTGATADALAAALFAAGAHRVEVWAVARAIGYPPAPAVQSYR
ncbi:MAG: ComF family protein [Gammaproteobacteria bacterium]|nr:ComF family protein [Gammaproteobacteria bacterium]